MRKAWLLFAVCAVLCTIGADQALAPLPVPLTNNAVTSVRLNGQLLVYSFMGLGPDKTANSVTNNAYALNVRYNKWTTVRAVPGSGRLGAVAAAARDQIFVVGGFVPDRSGLQAVVPDLSIYDPAGLRWYRGPDLPNPVRDAVAGVYRDRFIYVVGGFSKKGLSNEVQMYDAEAQRWEQATPSPGTPVFGHAGTVVGDTIIYIDGAKKNDGGGAKYVASDECWMGKIDRKDPKKIQWSKLPPHPGSARYRIAAGGSDREPRAYFAGGSDAVYDYSGVGVDKKPGEPSPVTFAYDFRKNSWETIEQNTPRPTMDHHGLVVTSDGLIVVGGMAADQTVVANTEILEKGK